MVRMLIVLLFLISITYSKADVFPPTQGVSPALVIASHAQNRASKPSTPVALYLGHLIKTEALKRGLDPLIVASIISVESDFRFIRVNNTGDYGITQINYNIWSREFKRLGKGKLSKNRLINDTQYSIKMMVKILKITKNRFPNDPLWYARYHSSTPRLKNKYAKKVKNRLQEMKNFDTVGTTKLTTNQGDNSGITDLFIAEQN
jgi:soluble lytic murein transglycosylase-like protein